MIALNFDLKETHHYRWQNYLVENAHIKKQETFKVIKYSPPSLTELFWLKNTHHCSIKRISGSPLLINLVSLKLLIHSTEAYQFSHASEPNPKTQSKFNLQHQISSVPLNSLHSSPLRHHLINSTYSSCNPKLFPIRLQFLECLTASSSSFLDILSLIDNFHRFIFRVENVFDALERWRRCGLGRVS